MERLIGLIKSHPRNSLLHRLSEISRNAYNKNEPIERWTVHTRQGSLYLPTEFLVTPWDCSQLAFLALLHADPNSTAPTSDKQIVSLLNEVKRVDDERTTSEMEGLTPSEQMTKIIFGLTHQQFGYQNTAFDTIEYFNRMYQVLFVIAKETGHFQRFNEACEAETGLSMSTYINCLFFLFSQVTQGIEAHSITLPPNSESILEGLTNENYHRLLSYLSIEDHEIQSVGLDLNSFVPFPLLRSHGQLLVVDYFLLANKFFEGPYWAIRSHFMKLRDQYFVNTFGDLAEEYVLQMFHAMLSPTKFQRLPTIPGEKAADWKLESQNLVLLVEQKSCASPIGIKKMFPNIDDVKKYFARINEALVQLEASSRRTTTAKRKIHVVLIFDRLFVLDTVIKSDIQTELVDLQYITISQFEELIALWRRSESDFEKLLIDKCDSDNTSGQKDISTVLERRKTGYASTVLDHFRSSIPRTGSRQ